MVDDPRANPDETLPEESDTDRPVDDHDAMVPVPKEEVTAPPLDIDEREGHAPTSEAIAMPEHGGSTTRTGSWNNTINDLIPPPRDEPHHDDDVAATDPYDATDDVDVLVPQATGNAADETDDFSTEEELGVDNAPSGENPDHDETVAVNEESAFYSTSYMPGESPTGELETDLGATEPIVASRTVEASTTNGTTTCPVCGQVTDALRFCGYCGSALTEERRVVTGDTWQEQLQSRANNYLEPLARWSRPGAVRAILAVGGVLALLSLLANSGALALIIGAAIVPAIVLYWCRQSDVFQNEPIYVVIGFGMVGVVIGALLGWLGAITTTGSWFDEGVLNFGAAGFGGRFADAAGAAPFMVWLVCGILVPALAIAAMIASPLLSRQFTSLGNEIMDGLTVAAAMGGGFALGTAIVFVAPMFGQDGPAISPSAWTLTTIGITIIRPLIWTLGGAMIGAGAWRYLLSGELKTAMAPVTVGILAPLLATLLSIQLAPSGLWAEILFGVVVAAVVAVFYQRTLADAIRDDRRVLGNDDSRIVCPHCHRVTPAGQFCAHCGGELRAMPESTAATA